MGLPSLIFFQYLSVLAACVTAQAHQGRHLQISRWTMAVRLESKDIEVVVDDAAVAGRSQQADEGPTSSPRVASPCARALHSVSRAASRASAATRRSISRGTVAIRRVSSPDADGDSEAESWMDRSAKSLRLRMQREKEREWGPCFVPGALVRVADAVTIATFGGESMHWHRGMRHAIHWCWAVPVVAIIAVGIGLAIPANNYYVDGQTKALQFLSLLPYSLDNPAAPGAAPIAPPSPSLPPAPSKWRHTAFSAAR